MIHRLRNQFGENVQKKGNFKFEQTNQQALKHERVHALAHLGCLNAGTDAIPCFGCLAMKGVLALEAEGRAGGRGCCYRCCAAAAAAAASLCQLAAGLAERGTEVKADTQ